MTEVTLECFDKSSQHASQLGRAKSKKEKSKKNKKVVFFAGFQVGLFNQEGAACLPEHEQDLNTDTATNLEEDTSLCDDSMDYDCEYDDCIDDEGDDDYVSNWKRGSKVCRSTSGNTKPKARPNRIVRAAVNKKSKKRSDNVAMNSSAQKENIEQNLAQKGIKKFGFEIYEKRAEPQCTSKKSRQPASKSLYRTDRHSSKKQEDHPAALRYELRSDNVPKGSDVFMNQMIDLQHRDLTPEDYELLLLLDEGVGPKTVSKSVLESMTVNVVAVEETDAIGELCSICMEMYEASQRVKTLPCKHTFHVDCIDQWLSTASQNCPLDGLAIEVT